jgi:hypothetical protein
VTAQEIIDAYYDAWINKAGDLSEVPLAPNLHVRGPIASCEDADTYRAMARQAGSALRAFRVREQFVAGNRFCSIIDWEMALPIAAITVAEILDVADGQIVRGETIYDPRELQEALSVF